MNMKKRLLNVFMRIALFVVLVTVCSTTEKAIAAEATMNNFYTVTSGEINLAATGTYSATLQVKNGYYWNIKNGDDVTSWFVLQDGNAVFANKSGVATAVLGNDSSIIEITIDGAKISGFTNNGSSDIYVMPTRAIVDSSGYSRGIMITPNKVGSYTIPKLTINSEIYGNAFTSGHSTLKAEDGITVEYTPDTANIKLDLTDLDNSKIDSSNATVTLNDGDGYYADELILKPTKLINTWSNGETNYTLKGGDIEWNAGDYIVDNGGREWSCFGGDGSGNYYFNITVSGITYNGLPVASETFRVHVYIYGRDATDIASGKYSMLIPEFTWSGDGDKPILCDAYEDDFYVNWPAQVDASALTNSDITLTLYSQHGDKLQLSEGKDFNIVSNSAGKTEIALRYQYCSNIPVYTTMKIDVKDDKLKYDRKLYKMNSSYIYDVASVYAYEVQQGGGMDKNGTVVCYSFYGLNLKSWKDIVDPVTYTLKTDVNGSTKYYSEDENENAYLVDSADKAKQFDATGSEDYSIQLVNQSVYVTEHMNQTVDKEITGSGTLTFTKVYSEVKFPNPDLNKNITTKPGFVIGENWAMHQMWSWQPGIGLGWRESSNTTSK